LKIRLGSGLLLLNILATILILIISFVPSNIVRIMLGIPFVLFCPGYVLMLALFPRKHTVNGVERIALSFALSLAIVPLIGLLLNYSPWGLRLESILYSLASFIFIMSLIGWQRQNKVAEEERFGFKFHLTLLGGRISFRDKALSVLLVLAVLGALGAIGYAIAVPKDGQRFTEFYLLGPGGKTEYPQELRAGETATVAISIVNHEGETVIYRLEVRVNGVKASEIAPIALDNDAEWRQEVSFTPQVPARQKVEFILYRDGRDEPYLAPLHLWVNVVP
jgi:uncharacterized membrane protein